MVNQPTSGNLTTDKKSGDSFGWDTDAEWTAFQSRHDVLVESGALELGYTPPDEQYLHAQYDFSREDGSMPVEDHTGNGYDLTEGSYTGVTGLINGFQAAEFDGVDDVISSGQYASKLQQPFTIFTVYSRDGGGSEREYITGQTAGGATGLFAANWDGNQSLFSGSLLSGSSADTNEHIGTGIFNGANSEIRRDGTTGATGDAGTDNLDESALGGDSTAGSNMYGGSIGEVLIYDGGASDLNITGIEQYLSDKWGLAI